MKTPRVLGLTSARKTSRGEGLGGGPGFGFGLAEFEMSIRHTVWSHPLSFPSLTLPVCVMGRLLRCLGRSFRGKAHVMRFFTPFPGVSEPSGRGA